MAMDFCENETLICCGINSNLTGKDTICLLHRVAQLEGESNIKQITGM